MDNKNYFYLTDTLLGKHIYHVHILKKLIIETNKILNLYTVKE